MSAEIVKLSGAAFCALMWWPTCAGVCARSSSSISKWGMRVIWNGLTSNHHNIHERLYRSGLQPHRLVGLRSVMPLINEYNDTGYDDTSYFYSEIIDVRKIAENDTSDNFSLESPDFTHTSIPTFWTAMPDITSRATSGRCLSKCEKQPKRLHWVVYLENGLTLNHQINLLAQTLTRPCLKSDWIWRH